MTKTKWGALLGIVVLVATLGCSDDDDDVVDIPGETAAAETALDAALSDVISPLVGLVEFIVDNFGTGASVAKGGLDCPDTSGVCQPGLLTCEVGTGGLGLDFDFTGCGAILDDTMFMVDGDMNVSATPDGFLATLSGLQIDGGPSLSGTLGLTGADCGITVDVFATDGTAVIGSVSGCGENPDSGGTLSITLATPLGLFVANVSFDGTDVATATVFEGGAPFATCAVNLDPLDAVCSDI